ncbi:MAG: GtrA family protein [Sphingobacterium sp.]
MILKLFKYGICGITCLIIDFLITYYAKEYLKINSFLANILGMFCGLIMNYYINSVWTFHLYFDGFNQDQLIIFFSISILSIVLNNIILHYLIKDNKSNFYQFKFLLIIVFFFLNFLVNNYYTFKN